ncbi:MAG TPA: transposase [Usitatibacter sp.]|nr:transposase [Usitatibacter sp.]
MKKEPLRTHRRFSLSEKLAIVRESLVAGVTASHVARKHGIALNVLYYWRKVYREVAGTDLTRVDSPEAMHNELADLRLQVRNLERLLGQRTLEIALLKERLGKDTDHDLSSG